MDSPKKILTIDGGGLRGVFAAAIIEQMEKAAGKKARDIFDCLYGTSTGAILGTILQPTALQFNRMPYCASFREVRSSQFALLTVTGYKKLG